jgi:hypothetical protein
MEAEVVCLVNLTQKLIIETNLTQEPEVEANSAQ